MTRLSTGRRPALAMTPKQHVQSHLKSGMRLAITEDAIVKEVGAHGEGMQLAVLAAIVQEALTRMDDELAALPEGRKPFVWPVFPGERRLMHALFEEHRPSTETARRVERTLDELSAEATCDEVAVAALNAATYFCARHDWKPFR